MSIDDLAELTDMSTMFELSNTYATNQAAIYTPNGTSVPYISYVCNHASGYHETLAEYYVETYGVTLIEIGTCLYNCHSFAWYNTLASNQAWIPDPSVYMTDGSYTQVLNGTIGSSGVSVKTGDVIFYGSCSDLKSAHSAKMISNGTGVPIANTYVYSKWGACGVYKHIAVNVPEAYDTSIISAWHLAVEEEE